MPAPMDGLDLADYDYALPPEAIATAPVQPRDASRMLVLPAAGEARAEWIRQLPEHVRPGDVWLVNTSKVVPARLAIRRRSGARLEAVLMAPPPEALRTARRWQALMRNARSIAEGEVLLTLGGDEVSLHRDETQQVWLQCEGPMLELLQREGAMPLPPYILAQRKKHGGERPEAQDAVDYQSIFAEHLGAVAAPTASLHFTPALVAALQQRGASLRPVCLHVGAGTFLPVPKEHAHDVRGHRMHNEYYAVPTQTADEVTRALAENRRVVAVGTTALRAIETWAACGTLMGATDLFVRPGHRFRVCQALLTNFHVPQSTLMMLVSALCGRERILRAYAQALAWGFRFLSYGDATFLHGANTPLGLAPQKEPR